MRSARPIPLLAALALGTMLPGTRAARGEEPPPPPPAPAGEKVPGTPAPAAPQDPGDRPPPPGEGEWTLVYGYSIDAIEEGTGDLVSTMVEGVTFAKGEFEVEADSLVVWADAEKWRRGGREGPGAPAKPGAGKPEGATPAPAAEAPAPRPPRLQPRTQGERVKEASKVLGPVVHEIYAEGRVRFRIGDRTIRTERLYADFRRSILVTGKVTLSTSLALPLRQRSLPLVVRAERLRRTAVNELTLDRASYTTCDFGEPHYHFQCREFVLDEYDDHTSFTAYRNVLWWDPVPILYLPIIAGRSDFSTRPLRAVNAGRSSRFGTVVETLWGDDIQAGGERWGEWRLHADVRTRRGLGGGVDVDYRTADYEGRVTGYYQRDRADRDGFDDSPVPRTGRWQGKFEHRQRLGEDLRLDLSFRDFSDRNYQPEYFRKDALEEREPETYAHLRWAHGTDLAALTGEVRTAPFLTQTERLPGAEVHRVGGGVPLGPLRGVLDSLTYSVDAEGGRLDRLYDQRLGPTGERVWRVDAAARLEGSAGLGPVRIVPFLAAGRTGWQADSLPDGSDAADRLDFAGGVRAAIEARRDFPAASSDLFGFRGMRHVVGLDALYFNRWSVDRAPGDLVPLDSLESLERVEVVGARLRNRLQVVRGGRRVDWIDLEVRGLYFPDGLRGRAPIPGFREEGVEGPRFQDFTGEEKYRAAPLRGRWGPWEGDLRVMLRENLFLAGEGEYDPYDGALRTSLLGVRWFVLPKASIYAGDRRIRGDSDIYTLKADWSVSDRWALGVTQQADLRSGKGMLSEIAVRRLLHDFVIEFSFRDERTSHDRSFRVSIIPTSLWVAPTSLEKVGSLDYDAKRWYR